MTLARTLRKVGIFRSLHHRPGAHATEVCFRVNRDVKSSRHESHDRRSLRHFFFPGRSEHIDDGETGLIIIDLPRVERPVVVIKGTATKKKKKPRAAWIGMYVRTGQSSTTLLRCQGLVWPARRFEWPLCGSPVCPEPGTAAASREGQLCSASRPLGFASMGVLCCVANHCASSDCIFNIFLQSTPSAHDQGLVET